MGLHFWLKVIKEIPLFSRIETNIRPRVFGDISHQYYDRWCLDSLLRQYSSCRGIIEIDLMGFSLPRGRLTMAFTISIFAIMIQNTCVHVYHYNHINGWQTCCWLLHKDEPYFISCSIAWDPHLWDYILGNFHTPWGDLNTLRPRPNGRHFPDDIFGWSFLNEKG